MIKTKYDRDFPEATIMSYKTLKRKGQFRITDFWRALTTVFLVKEFEILELKSPHTLEFESYLMDVLIAWMKGEPVDFGEVEKAVYTFGDFTEMEKLLFESGRIQERLWAIYLYLIDPNMNL
jgi:hypothetical protein